MKGLKRLFHFIASSVTGIRLRLRDCVCLSPVEAAQTGIRLEYDYNFLSAFCGEHMLIQFNARSGIPVQGNFMLSKRGV